MEAQEQAVIQGKSFVKELLHYFQDSDPKADDVERKALKEEFGQFLFATDNVTALGDITTTSIRAIMGKIGNMRFTIPQTTMPPTIPMV